MRRLLIAFLLLFSAPLWAEDGKEPFFSQFRDWYCIAGVPFNNPAGITGETIDVKFQFSVKFLPIRIGKQWNLYFGYTHKTVWNAFGESAPFHDNAYMPGIYFIRKFEKGDGLILGIEHMSNGRPYHGNPLAHAGRDGGLVLAAFPKDRLQGMHVAKHYEFPVTGIVDPRCPEVTLNADIRGQIRGELIDENWKVIEGFGPEDCIPVRGNGTALKLTWRGKSELPEATLKLFVDDADLWACTVNREER